MQSIAPSHRFSHTASHFPKVRSLNDQVADRVERLADLFESPPQIDHPFNMPAFREALRGHPDEENAIICIETGFPLGLKDRDPSKLCRKVRNTVLNTRDIIVILDKAIKEAENGIIRPGKGWYQLNFLIVAKRTPPRILFDNANRVHQR